MKENKHMSTIFQRHLYDSFKILIFLKKKSLPIKKTKESLAAKWVVIAIYRTNCELLQREIVLHMYETLSGS